MVPIAYKVSPSTWNLTIKYRDGKVNWLGSRAQKSLARLEDTAIRDRKRKEILHGHRCLESLTISGPLPTGTEIEKTEIHDT